MAVVVLGEVPLMGAKEQPSGGRWTIDGVEKLLNSLTGVASVRIVAKPGSDIEEIHLLTTEEVTPKQTVRNVESALMAHFDLEVDHRKISVAQTKAPPVAARPQPAAPRASAGTSTGTPTGTRAPLVRPLPTSSEPRILFLGHQIETQRSQRVRMVVSVEWQGERYDGESNGPDVARGRLDAVANATLQAVNAAVTSSEGSSDFALTLDGVKIVEAFDRDYVLVTVHALSGRDVTPLAGTSVIHDTPDKAVIMASLQATDRWVRGRL